MLLTRLCYSQGYVTNKAILFTRLFYSQGYFTHKAILLTRLCYSQGYITHKAMLLTGTVIPTELVGLALTCEQLRTLSLC